VFRRSKIKWYFENAFEISYLKNFSEKDELALLSLQASVLAYQGHLGHLGHI